MKTVIRVISIDTEDVVKELDVSDRSPKAIERICNGLEVDMDMGYKTEVVTMEGKGESHGQF